MRRVAVAMMLAAMVCGCATDDVLAPPPTGLSAPGKDQWWQHFHSARLDELIDQAMAHNTDVAVAVARIRQADAQSRMAGAPLLPYVEAGFGGQRMRSPDLPGIQTVKQGNIYSPEITAGYELDFWGRNASSLSAAQARGEVSRFDRQTVTLSVQAAVADTYFRILFLHSRLTLARADLADAVGLLDAYGGRLELGAATELDVARSQTLVERQKGVIAPLEEQERAAQNALAVLTGAAQAQKSLETGDLGDVVAPAVPGGLPADLLTRRPDVQSAEAALRASRADVAVAHAALFPQISLTAVGGYASGQLTTMMMPQSALFTLAATLLQPIYEGGRLKAAEQLEQARADEAMERYRKASLSAYADVNDALTSVQKTTDAVAAQRRAMLASEHAYRVANAQMEGGASTVITTLTTERDLLQTRNELLQAQYNHIEATVSLYKALGGGWDDKLSAY